MRLRVGSDFVREDIFKPGIKSFLNFASFKTVQKEKAAYEGIKFYCDGMLLALFLSSLTLKSIKRFSFDFTSVADTVFRGCLENNKSIFLVGGTESQVVGFIGKVKSKYPELKVCGYSSGYFSSWDEKSDSIILSCPDVVIVSMGAGKQEKLAKLLFTKCSDISIYTSGGFIRQIAESVNPCYYPKFVNKFKLRAFYRMYKEPHTIKRYFLDYPISLFLISFLVACGKVKINVE